MLSQFIYHFMLGNLFKKKAPAIKKRNPDETDFCYYPFFQVLVSADGKYMPCSHHDGYITKDGKQISVDKFSIEQAWNSEYMQTLRQNFHDGVRNKGCSHCWKEQALGLKPMRYDSYGYNIPESQVKSPESPMRVEINASNVCNLRCRICWSNASTRWIKEAKELYGADGEVHYNFQKEASGNAAGNVKGIKILTNNISVKAETNNDLERKVVEHALLRYSSTADQNIRVKVSGNTITLNGAVYSFYQKEEAAKIAWNAPGVLMVNNELVIESDN